MDNVARKKLIQKYYSKRSKDYDRQKNRTWKSDRGFGNGVFDELLTALKEFRNRPLLEVGVGSGRNALPLLEKVKPQLVGLDLSKEMLRKTKTKMPSRKSVNYWLKWIVIQCSGRVTLKNTKPSKLRNYYFKVKNKKGWKTARKATARKLLTVIWYVLKEKVPYHES
jgi:hypothetical protein